MTDKQTIIIIINNNNKNDNNNNNKNDHPLRLTSYGNLADVRQDHKPLRRAKSPIFLGTLSGLAGKHEKCVEESLSYFCINVHLAVGCRI